MKSILPPLNIGGLKIAVPIIQGGMGVRVSDSGLAAAVANCGGAGTIASVGLGYCEEYCPDVVKVSNDGLRREIRRARELSKGVIGVNIMFALSNYEELVKTAAEEKADFIVSGAGLPLNLPELVGESPVRLLPIVSSARAANIIMKTWKRRYNRLTDAVVVEGPMAGGHLGFSTAELGDAGLTLEKIVPQVIAAVKVYADEAGRKIPVIAGGGVYTGADIAGFLKMGAGGVQIATRFVATDECPAAQAFKEAYLKATAADIFIIKSPVGMPGRALRTKFLDRVFGGETIPNKCAYRCLRSCNPTTVPYCIAKAMINAVEGRLDDAIVFAGSNVSRIDRIMPVRELMDELVAQANAAY
ncbi:MAG: nitronate monooxygenase family protein [Elusimicrobiaceae bacterium]|nr:nitronate monooxygenase family protein [Elusimicrobiaceae bacterium]